MPLAFEQQPRESKKAFAAFSLYLSQGSDAPCNEMGANVKSEERGTTGRSLGLTRRRVGGEGGAYLPNRVGGSRAYFRAWVGEDISQRWQSRRSGAPEGREGLDCALASIFAEFGVGKGACEGWHGELWRVEVQSKPAGCYLWNVWVIGVGEAPDKEGAHCVGVCYTVGRGNGSCDVATEGVSRVLCCGEECRQCVVTDQAQSVDRSSGGLRCVGVPHERAEVGDNADSVRPEHDKCDFAGGGKQFGFWLGERPHKALELVGRVGSKGVGPRRALVAHPFEQERKGVRSYLAERFLDFAGKGVAVEECGSIVAEEDPITERLALVLRLGVLVCQGQGGGYDRRANQGTDKDVPHPHLAIVDSQPSTLNLNPWSRGPMVPLSCGPVVPWSLPILCPLSSGPVVRGPWSVVPTRSPLSALRSFPNF